MVNSVEFGGFKGMDNVHEDFELPRDILRRAINMDVLDTGRLKRREGSSQALAIAGAHSMWSDGASAYFVASNALRKFLPNGTSSSLGAFAAGVNRAAYVKVNNDVLVTSATARARISGGALQAWGIEVPSQPPVLTASAGIMPAGTYYAAVTYLLADGKESGASTLASITLSVAGGIATTWMPTPIDPLVTRKRLYLSTGDGEVLFMAAEVGAADQFVNIGVAPSGNRLRTAYLSPPPLGIALAHYNGVVFIVDAADPRVLWYTEPLDYDHVDTRKNYCMFESPVTVIAAASDGVFVCADNTYFIGNAGSTEASQRVVLEFGAISGTAASIPNTTNVIWMTEHGPAIGKDGGVIDLIAEKAIASGGMVDAAAMVREKDGLRQFVVVGSNTEGSALQAGSYAEAEIIRRST